MYKKDTEELLAEIKNDADMEKFLSKNRKEFKKPLHEYLSQIVEEKGLNKKDIVKNSNLNPNYVYHILSGERTNPSRPKLIAIAMAMNLNFDEIQYLLRYVGFSPLYPRNPWDTIVISAVNKGLSVLETDNLLDKLGETVLLGNVKKIYMDNKEENAQFINKL